ncbi:MAG: hypothetical protein J07HX64_02969 [halophilic archaeon J07HX64]|nr:MAG: hypothetical protein J07HX64_02969 [halophilic archaeon J07HX64]
MADPTGTVRLAPTQRTRFGRGTGVTARDRES